MSVKMETAINAVMEACRLTRAVQKGMIGAGSAIKEDKSPVTVADFGAQALICLRLQENFPSIPIVAEEDAGDLRSGGKASNLLEPVVKYVGEIRPELSADDILTAIDLGGGGGGPVGSFWTLDPIDGTKGFIRGDQYAVALALVIDGQVELGVLGCPNMAADFETNEGQTGSLFHAARNQGSFQRSMASGLEQKISVSQTSDPAQAVFCESMESGHSSHDDSARVADMLGVKAAPVRMDSQAKYGSVSRGESSVYLRLPTRPDYQEKIWDHAAGSLIVKEAGGAVTDVHGKELDFASGRTMPNNAGIIADNGLIHEQVLGAVNKVLKK